ncbi:MAG: hypothetical protein ACTHKG_05150, partial [Nocardioides sp.]
LAAAALVSTAFWVPGLTSGLTSPSPARPELGSASTEALAAFDAAAFPEVIDANVRETFDGAFPAFTDHEVTAYDSQGQPVPQRYRDRASGWRATYGWSSTHWLEVNLFHSGSESEGDAQRSCDGMVESGYAFACTVDTGPHGEVVVTTVDAMRKDPTSTEPVQTWIAVRSDEKVQPDRLWFTRSVEARRGGIYVASAREVVKVPSLAAATEAFRTPTSLLEQLALDPELVFPAPEPDEHGCPWTVPGTGYGCQAPAPDHGSGS